MLDRGTKLKQRQRLLRLRAKEISEACKGGEIEPSIDTIRKLGQVGMSPEMLNAIEAGIEKARLKKQSLYSLEQEAV